MKNTDKRIAVILLNFNGKNLLERFLPYLIKYTDKKISIYGYVKTSITSSLEDEMYVEDVILLAGGYQEAADQTQVDISRFEINPNDEPKKEETEDE